MALLLSGTSWPSPSSDIICDSDCVDVSAGKFALLDGAFDCEALFGSELVSQPANSTITNADINIIANLYILLFVITAFSGVL